MRETLLLNATYEPLCVVSQRRAAVLVLLGRAEVVQQSDGVLRSERVQLPRPDVIRLTRYVKVPYQAVVPLTRKAVFARDGGRCVYCRAAATSLDHVVPRSRGGTHTWDNVVAACGGCNGRKGDRLVADLGWVLVPAPRAPSGAAWRVLGSRTPRPEWAQWLGLADPAGRREVLAA